MLLRESSTARISSEPKSYIEIPQRHLVRVNDVFARTTTDRDGRFRFAGAKSPAMPKHWSNSWRGDVVAGHPQSGLGWTRLGSKSERHRVDSGLTIALRPTATITGEYLAPDRTPISGGVVYMPGCELPSLGGMATNDNELDLQSSQLTPRFSTEDAAEFSFVGIPQGCLALVMSAGHGQWLGDSSVIATSADVPLGKGTFIFGKRDAEVNQSPITLLADPGVEMYGTLIDEDGLAIQGARINSNSYADFVTTDPQGHFSLRQKSESWKAAADRNKGKVKIAIQAPEGSDFVSRYQDILLEEVLSGNPIRLTMQHGVRVAGNVITSDGKPLPEVLICQVASLEAYPASDRTNDSGDYELILLLGRHTLVYGTDIPGYQLPTARAAILSYSIDSVDKPCKTFDVSEGNPIELEPLVVQRSSVVKVAVVLPDGQPAVGVTLVLRDVHETNRPLTLWPFKRLIDISDRVETDDQGRAELVPKGIPSGAAVIEASLDTRDGTYYRSVKLIDLKERVVQLRHRPNWRLQGRVLLNGKPIVGARVNVGEANQGTGPVPFIGTGPMMIRNQDAIITDSDGWYRVTVPKGKQYSVSIQSVPGFEFDLSGSFHFAKQISEGIYEVEQHNFVTGAEEIAGVILDSTGSPLPAVHVQIMQTPTARTDDWLGHSQASDRTTDANGRFHLRKIPQGTYELQVTPRFGNRQRIMSTLFDATTGDLQLRLNLDTTQPPEPPRLQHRKVDNRPTGNEPTASIRGRLVHDGKPPSQRPSWGLCKRNDRRELKRPPLKQIPMTMVFLISIAYRLRMNTLSIRCLISPSWALCLFRWLNLRVRVRWLNLETSQRNQRKR